MAETQTRAVPRELELGDALALAMHMHRQGDLTDAETLYRRVLEVAPEAPEGSNALHFLGVLLHQRDQSDAALDCIQRSIDLDPDNPDRYNNFGNALVERGRLFEATEAYQAAIARQPGHANAWNNLGALLREQKRYSEAAAAYQKAIDSDPEHVDAYNNYGNLLSRQGRHQEAIQYYCKAITLLPEHHQSRKLLGIAYYSMGQIDAAAEVFRKWQEAEPDNPVAAHLYAACSGHNVPARASDAYIQTTFDAFAASFDAKLERLTYRAPQRVAEQVGGIFPVPRKQLDILDAGCGTGLCGPLLAPWAWRLTGVDLSEKMLALAGQRNIYDALLQAELTAYLQTQQSAFDLIVSADTLVYFGALEAFMTAAVTALRDDGAVIFTVEAAPDAQCEDAKLDDDYRINPHGRYSHRRDYVRRVLRDAGFSGISIDAATLRTEGGRPVAGLVVTARRPPRVA